MDKVIKQYSIEFAYTQNSEVQLFENGVLVNSRIIADWELSGYIIAIEMQGYKKAVKYDVLDKKIKNLQEEIKFYQDLKAQYPNLIRKE